MDPANDVWRDVQRIRERSPLVLNIINFVAANIAANALLALGASPAMSCAVEEMEDLVGASGALVVNIGTLDAGSIAGMRAAWLAAKARGVPVVFDPVAVGASSLRKETAASLLGAHAPTIIRGNASEIMALAQGEALGKGVDSLHSSDQALEAAKALAKRAGCVVCVSGVVDYVTDGLIVGRVSNGHGLMPRVTGLGCTASALCGAFAAVNGQALEAAAHAMTVMGLCGEIAAGKAEGPGTFQAHFLDALYSLGESDVRHGGRLEWM